MTNNTPNIPIVIGAVGVTVRTGRSTNLDIVIMSKVKEVKERLSMFQDINEIILEPKSGKELRRERRKQQRNKR